MSIWFSEHLIECVLRTLTHGWGVHMRMALVVGINHYEHASALFGCVNDAFAVKEVLAHHGDGTRLNNFECKTMTAEDPSERVTRGELKDAIEHLFRSDATIALLYFAGHGHIEAAGGYLMATDSRRGDEGVSLGDILTYANKSTAANKIVVLDSCHSGIAGVPANYGPLAALADGMTILTASTEDQYASEQNGRGVFTNLFVDALKGAAANLVGQITPGSVYAHIDQSLGAWEQRPVFKTNVKRFVSLRNVSPSISPEELRSMKIHFPSPGHEFPLDPTYEPEIRGRDANAPPPNPEHVAVFALLQKYNRHGLLVPVGAPHMWHAAMEHKACKLTALGEHYRRLVANGRI